MKVLHGAGCIAALFTGLTMISGCAAGGARCTNVSYGIQVMPASATINHAAASPGNQTQFLSEVSITAPPGCPISEMAARAFGTWSNPDPAAIQISSAADNTNGIAVCKAATKGAVTLTGTFTQLASGTVTKTVQLTCN